MTIILSHKRKNLALTFVRFFSAAKLYRHNWLLSKRKTEKQSHSSVTSPSQQTAWFITFGYELQSVTFQAWLIGNQDVIERLEQNEAGSPRIGTVTVFGFAQQHVLFGMLLYVLVYPTPALWNVNCIETMGYTSKKRKRKKIHALGQLQVGKRPSFTAATFIVMCQSYAAF